MSSPQTHNSPSGQQHSQQSRECLDPLAGVPLVHLQRFPPFWTRRNIRMPLFSNCCKWLSRRVEFANVYYSKYCRFCWGGLGGFCVMRTFLTSFIWGEEVFFGKFWVRWNGLIREGFMEISMVYSDCSCILCMDICCPESLTGLWVLLFQKMYWCFVPCWFLNPPTPKSFLVKLFYLLVMFIVIFFLKCFWYFFFNYQFCV